MWLSATLSGRRWACPANKRSLRAPFLFLGYDRRMNERIYSLKTFNEHLGRVLPGVLLEKESKGFRFVKGEAQMIIDAISFRNLSFNRWMEEARWFNTHC